VLRASPGAGLRCLRLMAGVAICALFMSPPASAKTQVFLVIADRLTLSDITRHTPSNIARLVRGGSIGLVNSTAAGRRTVDGAYLALGAGSGLLSSSDVYEGYDSSEQLEGGPASLVYLRRTGISAPAGSVVNTSVGPLAGMNAAKRSTGLPGAMGEALRRGGKRVAVFGNSDMPDVMSRPAVTVAMDAAGVVPEGVVGPWLLKDNPMSPTGKVADTSLMLRLVKNAASRADLIVIDFGDTTRLEEYRPKLSPAAYDRYLADSIDRLDQLLGGLLDMSDASGSYIILVSPLAREEDSQLERLSPTLLYHGSTSKQREPESSFLISSATTRTPGLVSITDIAPTVLSILRVRESVQMIGKPIRLVKQSDRMRQMRRLDSVVCLHTLAEWPVLGGMGAIGAIALTPLALIIAFRMRASRWLRALLRVLLAVGFSLPLALLLGSLYSGTSVIVYSGWLAAFSIGSVLAVWILVKLLRLGSNDEPLSALPSAIALATAAVIIVDAFTGGRLVTYALPGTYQLRGLRYYGIGNEYMGVLIGCTMMAAIWLRGKIPPGGLHLGYRALFAVLFAVVALVIGLPDLGADVGGAITAVVAFGLLYKALSGKRIGFVDVVVLLALSGVVAVALGLFDMLVRGGSGSHAGLTAKMVGEGGLSYLWAIVGRKVGMNLQLLGTRQGQTALLGFSPFFMLWFAGVQKRVNTRLAGRPEMLTGLRAVAIGAAVTFVFNDSGSVAASLLLCAPVCVLLYTLAGENGELNHEPDTSA
jgi:hypothetical protein